MQTFPDQLVPPKPDLPSSGEPVRAPQSNGLTIAQLVVSGSGLVLALFAAGGLALLGLIGFINRSADAAQTTSLFSVAWISLLVGLLAVPSVALTILRLSGRAAGLVLPQFRTGSFWIASVLVVLWPLVLLLGSFVSRQQAVAWLILPPLQLLAIGLPVWWFFEVARRKISLGSQQRGWGLVNFSIFVTTPALMVIEIVVLMILVVIFAIWISTQPELMRIVQRLAQQFSNGRPDPEAILPMITPYLQNPQVLYGALALMAGIIPLLEELFKPLAIWALAGRKLTPAEGFVAGALCGASFALIESLFYLSNPAGAGWASLAAGRAGTGLLHTTTTALMGWALASAWQNGSYLKLGLTYLLAAALHGLWNGLNILMGFLVFLNPVSATLRPLAGAARAAPAGIAILVVLLFALLWSANRHFRNQISTARPQDHLQVPLPGDPLAVQPAAVSEEPSSSAGPSQST